MMQRPRWGDLVDSSDDEAEFDGNWSDADMGAEDGWRDADVDIEPFVAQRNVTARPSGCKTPRGFRRVVRMPVFTKRACPKRGTAMRMRAFVAKEWRRTGKRRACDARLARGQSFVKTKAGMLIVTFRKKGTQKDTAKLSALACVPLCPRHTL
jgi:hypothetical protein